MARFLDTILVSPEPDGIQWVIRNVDGFRYISDIVGLITVPEGFCTDFGSVPAPLRLKFPPWSTAGPGYIIHDWLYFSALSNRAQADSVLRECMDVLGVDKMDAAEIYLGVRIGGQEAWARNAQLKASGFRRLVTGPDVPPYSGVVS